MSTASSLKNKVYSIIEEVGDEDSRRFELFILALIFLSIVALCLETVKSIETQYRFWFHAFDVFSIAIFSVEYLLRIWSCTAHEDYKHPLWGRIKYAFTTLALVDLIAILPFYLPFILPFIGLEKFFDLRSLRSIRLFRVFKLFRYSKTLSLFQRVMWDKRQELSVTLFFLVFLLLFASSVMFYAEHRAQPENFSSIPASMWWAIATLTTVGYGDVYPVTAIGRFFASIIAVLGIGLFALPTSILGAAFVEEVENNRRNRLPDSPQKDPNYCPHCGESLSS